MSFSSDLKESLSKISNLANKEIVKYELIGYLISNNTIFQRGKISYSTASQYNINRFNKLISNLNILDFKIDLKGKIYTIILPKIENLNEIQYENKDIVLSNTIIEELKNTDISKENQDIYVKSLIRGIFLGSGSVNNPENKYHLEIILSTKQNAEIIKELLDKLEIKMKLLERKSGYSLYIKDADEISKFLAFIGANSAVLKFEEIRVIRDMKNNINRKVNCETANITKTINAAVKQIDAIKKLKKTGKFENLSDSLKEIAELRLENPDASLIELGEMLKNPIGKSGVNHRLKQIEELAK